MNAKVREHIERVPMSIEEYEAVDDDYWDEYIDGAMIARPSPRVRHEDICGSLLMLFREALPSGVVACHGAGWSTDGNEFRPDIVVADHPGDVHRLTDTPHLIVEVLGDDSFYDTVIKHQKYAAAGLPRYWIVDPKGPTLWVYHLMDGDYRKRETYPAGKKVTLDIGLAEITLDPGELVA